MSGSLGAVPPLLAGFWTLAGQVRPGGDDPDVSPHPVAERVRAAAEAGFTGMGFYYDDLAVIERTLGFMTLRELLREHGIVHGQFEGLESWWADGAAREASDVKRDTLLRAVQVLELPDAHLKCLPDLTGAVIPLDVYAPAFYDFAARAEAVGARLGMEFIPFADISTPKRTLELVERAAHPNAGVVIDTWHVVRGGTDYDSLRHIPGELIVNVELDDADAEPLGDLGDDTVDNRRLCGEGAFGLPAFLDAIRSTGYDGCYAVEIISHDMRAMPLDQAARRVYDTTARQFGLLERTHP